MDHDAIEICAIPEFGEQLLRPRIIRDLRGTLRFPRPSNPSQILSNSDWVLWVRGRVP
jgi:hypothetical protein